MSEHRRNRWLLVAPVVALVVTTPAGVVGQVWFVEGAVGQSFTTSDPLPSPLGFEVGGGVLRLVGPVGLHLSYREVSESAGEVPVRCDMSSCVPGPFDRSYTMTTFGLGISYDFVNPTGVFLTVALTGASNWQIEHLEEVGTGEAATGARIGSDRSLGASVHLRLRPWWAGTRPTFAVRYDRIWGRPCVPDAACLPARNAFGLSAGLAWLFGPAPARE